MVCHKVYKNIKLKSETKQPFILKVRYKEQRSKNIAPFIFHSGLRTLEISRILYHSVLLCYSIQVTTFIHVSNSPGTVGRKALPENKNLLHTLVILTLGISRSLVDSCLDFTPHEATIPTHNREVFRYNIRHVRTSIAMENDGLPAGLGFICTKNCQNMYIYM